MLEICIEFGMRAARCYSQRLRGICWRVRNEKRNFKRQIVAEMRKGDCAKQGTTPLRESQLYSSSGAHGDVCGALYAGRVDSRADRIAGIAHKL